MIKRLITIVMASAALTTFAQGNSGELLYNGIRLPEQWPPRYAEPTEAHEMPVPYLQNKPQVIPVNVGR